ncbi:MAG TPA: hypothetical protein VG672_03150 [Bryobacteraceae bacterium]|jgi:tetratricopeptide (TPR) repeat protein|nr:hypothetical protein [Bryobacteraceae bacterium]
MRTSLALLAALLAAGSGFAQCHKIGEVNAEKPEGQLLQKIGQESDEAKKAALLDEFVAQYPQHEAAGWVYEQILTGSIKANNGDKALAAGEKLAAIPPACVEDAHQTLKAAELKKDADQIRTWSAKTSELALQVVNSPQPKEQDEVEDWKRRVDYARQVNTYTEYSLYAAALQVPDPQKKAMLIEALEQRNPKSEYLAQAYPAVFLAYQQSKQTDKALEVAEKMAASGTPNEDMLLVLADNYLQKKKDPEKVHVYSAKIVEIMSSKPKPDGVSDADWASRKNLFTGLAHYMSGKQYFQQNKLAQADKELREALPLVQGNVGMKAETLFLLGVADYKLEKPQDAVGYFRACAAIKSPYQGESTKNIARIKQQYAGLK